MVWSRSDSWMVTADQTGYVKYWQSNMNNVKMFQAHKEPVRAIRCEYFTIIRDVIIYLVYSNKVIFRKLLVRNLNSLINNATLSSGLFLLVFALLIQSLQHVPMMERYEFGTFSVVMKKEF